MNAGRVLQSLRKVRRGGRPRSVIHDPKAQRCLCVECRKDRGHYPITQTTLPAPETTAKRPKLR